MDTGLETYPDVTVVCGKAEVDPEDRNVITNPVVVVEVTSRSTDEYDRVEKPDHYKRIPSLREVVFVGHAQRVVESCVAGKMDPGRNRTRTRVGGHHHAGEAAQTCKNLALRRGIQRRR